jgi:two-component system sensor histidine kinase CpxA
MADSPFDMRKYIPYYLPILAAVALLCWALAARIASPLRDLTRAVERFGSGDLSARVHSRRHDEIGELSAAFDRMAERIGTLLTAERRLLQDVSHELRTPLARMTFAADLARTAPDREAAVARLKKEIHRLTSLVGALIEATRAEGEPSAMTRENILVNALLNQVAEDCRLEAEAHGCRMAIEEDDQTIVLGDPELLRRAFENVLRNAIRYSPEGAAINIGISATRNLARISVRDYGQGVPEEALKKIFEPFFRVDDSRASATGGVGLGLTIADRAIKLQEGRIWAENVHPGLKVLFEIPLAAGTESPRNAKAKAASTPAAPAHSG